MNIRRRQRKKSQPVSAKSQSLPQGDFTARITELLTDGRGLSHIDGKAVMMAGALPDETVMFRYSKQVKNFYEGEVVDVITASPTRIVPKCKVFSLCGGCVLQHVDADEQITFKHEQLFNNVQKQIGKPSDKLFNRIEEPLVAQHWGYRRRARVGLKWQSKEKHVDVGFRRRGSSHIVPTDSCEILAPELSALFPAIAQYVGKLQLPDSITHVEMTLAETAEKNSQIALTFRHVKPLNDVDKAILVEFAETHHVEVYLQSGGDDTVVGLNHNKTLSYFLEINGYLRLKMDFLPYHFTQVNFAMNSKMVAQALDWLDLQTDDCVLDLFCGLGNFTLPIAQRVNKVVGVEGLSALVDWAKRNAENNHIKNAEFHQADLTQNTKMMAWRVKNNYNKILIDPPRAGAADIMPLLQALKPERICYVSCHGATLARDLKILIKDYRLEKMGAMDMFPQTAHVEAMALLVRK